MDNDLCADGACDVPVCVQKIIPSFKRASFQCSVSEEMFFRANPAVLQNSHDGNGDDDHVAGAA